MKKTGLVYIEQGTKGKITARSKDPGDAYVTSVSIDSRHIPENCLFFCIIGNRVDAHTFLPDVRDKGCHNVVVSDPKWAERMAEYGDMNVILTDDTRLAMMNLAEKYLDDWKGLKKVGVTGSVGKTGTKEFLYSVLRSRYRTGKTPGNLNSEYGIPLTAFSLDENIEVAVIELGAGHGSGMKELAKIVKPDAAVITTIGSSHLEVFGTRENILREKLQIASGFTPENTLVINTDSDILTKENVVRAEPSNARIVTVGTKGNSDYILYNICDQGIDGVKCTVAHSGETGELIIPVIGAHNLGNAAEAIAIGEIFGISMKESIRALARTESNDNRLDVIRMNGCVVINDTYNASPESMKAGIDVMMRSPGERKIAVLGDMYELGEQSAELHRSVGRYAADQGVDVLITIGNLAKSISEAAQEKNPGMHIIQYNDREEAAMSMKDMLLPGDVVFVKASRSMELEKLVDVITNRGQDV